jgi:hypothetical protein
LPQRVSIFYDFFTLKFSPVKFVLPLGGVVQNKYLCRGFRQNILADNKWIHSGYISYGQWPDLSSHERVF